jgi:rubrerythrin
MDQLSKEQYIEQLQSAPWQDIKEEADKYGVEKTSDEKWKDLVLTIADEKFKEVDPSDNSLAEEKEEVVEECPIPLPQSFDYVRERDGSLVCPTCGYSIRTGFSNEKICPVSNPKCPRPGAN